MNVFRIVVALLFGVLSLNAEEPSASPLIPVTVFHTTDIHAYFFPSTDYEGNENSGGLLRLAHHLDGRRQEIGEHLLLDCGDTIQGAPEGFLSKGLLPVEALSFLKYDGWVIGNHELDWGLDAFKAVHDHAETPMIAANMLSLPDSPHPLPKLKPYIIKEVNGVRVAVIGLNTPGVPFWTRPDYLGNLIIEDSIDALKVVLPQVKGENPDIIILALHQGHRPFRDDFANQINAITRQFPELDAVLGGHTHKVCKERNVNNVFYCQAGYHAHWYGELTFQIDAATRKIVRKESVIHHITDEVPYHEAFYKAFKPQLDQVQAELDQVIGEVESEITASYDFPGCSPMQQLISKAIAASSGAEMVIHGVLSDHSLSAGPIRSKDIWDIIPYENRIGIAHLTASEIRDILYENFSHEGRYSFMGVYGMNVGVSRSGDEGFVIEHITLPDGTKPHGRKRFSVAFNSYVLASGGKKFMRLREIVDQPEARLTMMDVQTRQAVSDYIKSHSPITQKAGTQLLLIGDAQEGQL